MIGPHLAEESAKMGGFQTTGASTDPIVAGPMDGNQ
jgi:hypothetical protein